MKQIEGIREQLREIRLARWTESSDPSIRPGVTGLGALDRLASTSGPSTQPIDFDFSANWQYPDWVEKEIFERLDRKVEEQGIEALAWYVSFHVNHANWGIFLPISSLAYLENRCLRRLRRGRPYVWSIAQEILVEHELFHFLTDYVCAQWEILMETPCWAWVQHARCAARLDYLEIEEKLANAHMLRTLQDRWPKSVHDSMGSFIASQPPGYKEGLAFTEENHFSDELIELIKNYIGVHAVEKGLNLSTDSFDSTSFFALSPRIDGSQCPLHFLHDENLVGLPQISMRFIQCIPNIVETNRFQKDFQKLDKGLRNRWVEIKDQLSNRIPKYPDFEKLTGKGKKPCYSIRLNDNFRVHLQPGKDRDFWEAICVGSHKSMGHG